MDQEVLLEETAGPAEYGRLWTAGASVKGEFHCAECSYGVIVTRQLPTCPMCGGAEWEQATWSPFARSRALI